MGLFPESPSSCLGGMFSMWRFTCAALAESPSLRLTGGEGGEVSLPSSQMALDLPGLPPPLWDAAVECRSWVPGAGPSNPPRLQDSSALSFHSPLVR